MKLKTALMTALTVVAILHGQSYAAEQDEKRSDVRVLIDISGSMKKNDPKNLRIPALRIITNLMPKGSDSGVWAFGRYVNMLVPLKTVDETWQNNANIAAGKINSAGLFTNIGDAMAKSSWDWTKPDSTENRSMILLTDGMVDISKDPTKNKAEREKILNAILPRLKKAGVTIHTVALSEDADTELLSTLANETDGWFKQTSDAEELQRLFLKIFEQATPRDSLPLENNAFKVDASIEEMTLLVFKQSTENTTKLITPSGTSYTADSRENFLRWFASDSYDLITITKPDAGDWQIDAAVDPDNRVMVVSKLGLAVTDLPNNVLAGEQINYSVKLLEEGEVITKPDFLNLVDAKLKTDYAGQSGTTPLLKDAATGEFKQVFFAGKDDGVLEIKLEVKSPTFERSRTHAINIYGNPIQSDLQTSFIDSEPHKIYLRVAEGIFDLEQLKLTGKVEYPDETSQFVAIEQWQSEPIIEVKQYPEGGTFKVSLTVEGVSLSNRSFKSELPEIVFTTEALEGYGKQEPEPEPEPEPEEKQPAAQEQQPALQEKTEEIVEQPVEPVAKKTDEDPESEPEPEPINWTLWL
ncbi:MAG: vWA domain-containing protein, partial [Kangiellaceae bacterium]|nr:vWA domain-containing protein [Kangiellaceae bacterium]